MNRRQAITSAVAATLGAAAPLLGSPAAATPIGGPLSDVVPIPEDILAFPPWLGDWTAAQRERFDKWFVALKEGSYVRAEGGAFTVAFSENMEAWRALRRAGRA